MRLTLHSRHRMSQRGIPQRLAMHVLDKGGITVVEDNGGVITTWNRNQ
jgi:hypothetical protein